MSIFKVSQAFALAKIAASRVWLPKRRVKLVQTRANGVELLVFANEDVGRELVFGGAYEIRETRALCRLVRPDDICFDVGANIGYYTTLFARLAHSGSVHAFEPAQLNWHVLNTNLLLNRFRHVSMLHAAVGETAGSMPFSVSRDGAFSSLKDTGRDVEVDLIETSVITIDDYVRAHNISRIDVMKVDVEGAEGLVINGAKELLSGVETRPRVLMLELYDSNLVPFGFDVKGLAERIEALGYTAHIAGCDGELIRFEAAHRNRHCNVFFTDNQPDSRRLA